MKKILLLTISLISLSAFSQRIAYIESEYILGKVKSYAAANENLDKISQEWQKDIEDKMRDLDLQYKKFQAEQSLYTGQMKQDKIKEIEKKESDISELQKKRFGPNGDLFKKRQELVQPIVTQMFDEVQKIAEAKSFDYVIDKSNGNSIVFSNSKLNISDDVLKAMSR